MTAVLAFLILAIPIALYITFLVMGAQALSKSGKTLKRGRR